jgi:hypothetical protein
MAASVINSKRAVEVSVYIVRAFVRFCRMIAEHKELSRRIVQIFESLWYFTTSDLGVEQR